MSVIKTEKTSIIEHPKSVISKGNMRKSLLWCVSCGISIATSKTNVAIYVA